MNVLEIKNLYKNYGKARALDGVSFSIEKGKTFGFLGPNGAGKSTTIKIIMDFLHHDKGSVTVFEVDAHNASVELKNKIGYVPAEPVLYPNWKVDEHIRFVAKLHGGDVAKRAAKLKELLQLDGKKKVRELSTGNQQKLAIVLALATNPSFLILDEPTRGLDPLLRATFHDLLREYKAQGGTVLLSSHDLSEVEELCDEVVIIHQGKIVQDTTIEKLRANHQHKVKVRFDGSAPDMSHLDDIENLVIAGDMASFAVKGDLNTIVGFLAKHSLKDVEITSASLEDIFKEIYQ